MALGITSLPLGLGLGLDIVRARSVERQHTSLKHRISAQERQDFSAWAYNWGCPSCLLVSAGYGEEHAVGGSLSLRRNVFTLLGGERRSKTRTCAVQGEGKSPGPSSAGSESDQAALAQSAPKYGGAYNGLAREFLKEENGSLKGEFLDSSSKNDSAPLSPSPSVGPKEPVYEVFEVRHTGKAVKKFVSRRQLLRTSGLRLRDLRRVDPSLWVTNSAPALLVRDEAILINLGSLRAIATTQEVLVFDQKSVGAQAFTGTLIRRLKEQHSSNIRLPFELEVIESALISRTQRVEKSLMDVEPRVLKLLEVLPNCMTADVLEDLRVSKQELVDVGAKAGALRQMLLELLEHPNDIRRMVIMGHGCDVTRDNEVACVAPQDKEVVEDEAEEMEMLLEYYLQRCESCHGQSLKLLSSAKEMEDSIGVNLSSRRLEVSRLELLLQVGTFCAALGALVAGIFGMNLRSYLEEHSMAFFYTTAGIIFGGIALFIIGYTYLSKRKIL